MDPFAFFAVQVEVVQIGKSQLAPVFNVLENPNKWNRQVKNAAGLTEVGKFRQDFWAHYAARHPDAPGVRAGYASSNIWHKLEEANLCVVQVLEQKSAGVYLIGSRWGRTHEDIWPRVERYVGELSRALADEPLSYGKDHYYQCLTEFEIDSRDRGNWDRMADWLDDRRRTYEHVLCSG